MWYGHTGMGGSGWPGMNVAMIVFWGIVIWVIMAMFRCVTRSETQKTSSDQHGKTLEAGSSLKGLFVTGEIDDKEYVRRRDILLFTGLIADGASAKHTECQRAPEAVTN